MEVRVGIIGVSGYGGGELLRYLSVHSTFQLEYIAGLKSAGALLGDRLPTCPKKYCSFPIRNWELDTLPELDLLFISLPTGASRDAAIKVPPEVVVVDLGGDHRFSPGWEYGLADVWPDRLANSKRIANPGCFATAMLTAIFPLVDLGLVSVDQVFVSGITGVSGAGRGGGGTFDFAEMDGDFHAYAVEEHPHVREIRLGLLEFSKSTFSKLCFVPHLCPVTRGLLVTAFLRMTQPVEVCVKAGVDGFAKHQFVRYSAGPPHAKWAIGSNYIFVNYSATSSDEWLVCTSAIDNLGKGAAGQAIQNANLAFGLPANDGLTFEALWP